MGMEEGLGSDLGRELLSPSLPSPPKKKKGFICKLVVAALVVGLALFLFFGGIPVKGQCDLFDGQWVPDPSRPLYTNTSCNYIDDASNCLKNGRPDSGYLYWTWKPYNCDIPPFDAEKFMNAMRDKSWALIGDSILRNQMQSLVCLLSKIEEPVEIYHDEAYKTRIVHFPINNFTLATLWAPFLVKSEVHESDDGKPNKQLQLYLDVLAEEWTKNYHKYDYVVIASGQWFLKSTIIWENGKIIGCHGCEDGNLKELGIFDPYRKALQSTFNFIVAAEHKPLVIFRTWTPDHFEYGEWFSGGVCNRTRPYREGQFEGRPFDHQMRDVELEVLKKAKSVASKNGIHVELLDTFHLSLLRPDGHPGPYRRFHPFDKDQHAKVQNDCLHWCLPGPIDDWNDMMMKILMNAGALKSSTSGQKAAIY